VVVCCFFAGIVAETAVVRGLGRRAERLALLVPGYALMKRVGADFIGIEGKRRCRRSSSGSRRRRRSDF
jgi:hypothetical protein